MPDGQAPDWVREAWVGLELPIIGEESGDVASRPGRSVPGALMQPGKKLVGVLGGRASERNIQGYAVSVESALAILARKNQAAANWFREHLSPGMHTFRFGETFCEYLP